MGDLRTVSSLVIHTAEGDREVQLLFGDITQLPVKEKVDVIMVSAFPGDYSATPTSVIGALKRKLDLSVRNLARDRQEDLRKSFYCWWSKPLPREMPYRRLLCFERPPHQNAHPARLVGDVFRALFPAFNNQESTVITPLLATGDQNFSESVMLNAMVNAACKWIKHGLPLKCLKIVIYRGHDKIQKEFEALKKYWESVSVESKEPSIVYDVYISYCNQDKDKVQELQNLLKSEKEDIRIFAEHQELNQEAVFQDRIYDVMITCVKVVAVLSPAYLQSQECLEQFNVALCCDRKTKREMLAPFYVETIPALPTYMCMVQYIDVRINEKSTASLITGCKVFISYINDIVQDSSVHTEVRTRELTYDVFISYCHRNTEYATELFSIIQRLNPELRIFFDRNELTLGNSWQQTLYHAIDGSKCLIALISPEYLHSLVCTEEYNLALAKHLCWKTSDDSEFFIVPICISDLPNLKKMSAYIPIIDGRYEFSKVITKVAESVNRWINKSIFDENVMSKVEDGFSLCNIMENHRTKVFKDAYKQIQADLEKGFQGNLDKEKYHIGISYTRDASRYAEYLNKRIQLLAPELKTTFEVTNDAKLVSALEEVDVIIALVSPAYTVTRKTMDEFHHALGRHRIDKQGPVLYPVQIQSLPFKPLFFHLVPCNVNLEDKLWKNTSEMLYWKDMVQAPDAHLDSDKRKELKKVSEMLLNHELMALSYACNDIVNIIRRQRNGELQPETQNTVLENIVRIDMDNIDTTSELAMQVLTAEKQVFKRLPEIQVGSISEKSELTVNEQKCKMSDGEILSEKSAQADDPKSTKTSTGSQSETKQEYVESATPSSTPQSTKATENSDKPGSKNGSKKDISREESQVELKRSTMCAIA